MANIEDLVVENKRVLLRVDFNVPVDKESGEITDDTRLRAALPTIEFLRKKGAKVIMMSHFGRPKAKEDGTADRSKYGLQNVAYYLPNLFDKYANIFFVEDCIGEEVEEMIADMEAGDMLLLDNTRFYPEEEKGNAEFAAKLAALGDVYINDAFGAAHREHASTAVIARHFDSQHKAFGFLMRQELESANKLLIEPARPFVAIVGGAKVSDKILLLESLLDKVDTLVVGGGMAYTFFKAQGGEIGKSLVENDKLDLALTLIAKAKAKNIKLLLPIDSVAANAFSNEAELETVRSAQIPANLMGLDIGDIAAAEFSAAILTAKTIFWNGPMGVFEMENFANGTNAVAQAVVEATNNGAFSLVGGGDSVAALHQLGKAEQVSFVSTGGGAMLELIENGSLVGVQAIG
jgi:phosphoglycerate kinase